MMKFYESYFSVWGDIWHLIPTIEITYNKHKDFAIEFHFLCFHLCWLWIEQDMRGTEDEH